MRGFPGVVATQHGLPYADLWLWIIRTCNLLVLDSFAYKLSLPTRCKRKLGKKNPFDDVTRRPILELLCWQRIMRAGLTSVIVCSAIVNTNDENQVTNTPDSCDWSFHSHIFIYANKWEVVISNAVIPEIYHQTLEMSSAHFFSKVTYLADCLIFRCFSDWMFFCCFFFLRQAWNQTSWMRGFAKTSGNTRGGKSHRGQQLFCCSQGRRTTW